MTTAQHDIPNVFVTDDAKRAYFADRAAATILAVVYRANRMIDAYTLAPTDQAPSLNLSAGIWQLSAYIRQYCDVAQEEQMQRPELAQAAADHAERMLETLRQAADAIMERLQSHVDDLSANLAGAHESAKRQDHAHVMTLMSATARAHRDAGSAALKARHTTVRLVSAIDKSATIEEARHLHNQAARAYQMVASLHRRQAAALNLLDVASPQEEGEPTE